MFPANRDKLLLEARITSEARPTIRNFRHGIIVCISPTGYQDREVFIETNSEEEAKLLASNLWIGTKVIFGAAKGKTEVQFVFIVDNQLENEVSDPIGQSSICCDPVKKSLKGGRRERSNDSDSSD
jgi:hypothetical protein